MTVASAIRSLPPFDTLKSSSARSACACAKGRGRKAWGDVGRCAEVWDGVGDVGGGAFATRAAGVADDDEALPWSEVWGGVGGVRGGARAAGVAESDQGARSACACVGSCVLCWGARCGRCGEVWKGLRGVVTRELRWSRRACGSSQALPTKLSQTLNNGNHD
eukprot:363883-Chlamydomonas_euryale.AAC.5